MADISLLIGDTYLNEYPRPTLKRDESTYLNLNGNWFFSMSKGNQFSLYNEIIHVPYSPETKKSGINRIVYPGDIITYTTSIYITKLMEKNSRLILHFGAVDQICTVYINNKQAYTHKGGYLPFSVDITKFLRKDEDYVKIKVYVEDYTDKNEYSRGKQSLKPHGIWYQCQSGIWQSVWLECIPEDYIEDVFITPNVDLEQIDICVLTNNAFDHEKVKVKIFDDSKRIEVIEEHEILTNMEHQYIKLDNPRLWSPDDPYLYKVEITYKNDIVTTYFGMRKIEIKKINGVPYLYLNNKPIFLNGILEQGYYGDNLYTPDSYDTIEKDLLNIKSCGFNAIRKHVKIEPELYYYYCDKLGLLVVQDMVNGGGKYNNLVIGAPLFTNINIKDNKFLFKRKSEEAKHRFFCEVADSIHEVLYNHPSIIMYTLFNEGWGQYDTKEIYNLAKGNDPTRLYDVTSGWYDRKIGDVLSIHNYFKPFNFDKVKKNEERAIFLSEYGGYTFGENKFFYKHLKNEKEYLETIRNTIKRDIEPYIDKGLIGSIYTQYNDIGSEKNGIVDEKRLFKTNMKDVFKVDDKF